MMFPEFFPEISLNGVFKMYKYKNLQYIPQIPKPVGTLKKSLVDQSEGAQRCKTASDYKKPGWEWGVGGWVGGGVRSFASGDRTASGCHG